MTEAVIQVPLAIVIGEGMKIEGTALLSEEGLEAVIDDGYEYGTELLRRIVEVGGAKKAILKIELEEATPAS